jgi:tripartite-type tricarboxylate transporter receptor subunit TctC
VLEVLNAALRSTVQDETVAAQLEKIETYLLPLDQATPEALRHKLSSQIELWRPIIEKAGIKAE